eukprot:464256-Lingulodinium_polyedra.AAC.1
MLITQCFPVAAKGGRLCSLWKRKGRPSECAKHRGLTVTGHLSKALTALIKQPIIDATERELPSSQCGGRRRRTCAMIAHLSRGFLAWARAEKRKAFLLFLDLEKAFDTIARDLALGAGRSKSLDEVLETLRRQSVAEDVIQELMQELTDGGPLDAPAGLMEL